MKNLVCAIFVLLLFACGSSAKLHVVEPPSRRLGGSFIVKEVAIDPQVTATTAREDAALLARELRGVLAVVARDGAGDDTFIVDARMVRYDEAMAVTVDIHDRVGRRLSRLELEAPPSARGWTEAARETARSEIALALARYLQSNR